MAATEVATNASKQNNMAIEVSKQHNNMGTEVATLRMYIAETEDGQVKVVTGKNLAYFFSGIPTTERDANELKNAILSHDGSKKRKKDALLRLGLGTAAEMLKHEYTIEQIQTTLTKATSGSMLVVSEMKRLCKWYRNYGLLRLHSVMRVWNGRQVFYTLERHKAGIVNVQFTICDIDSSTWNINGVDMLYGRFPSRRNFLSLPRLARSNSRISALITSRLP